MVLLLLHLLLFCVGSTVYSMHGNVVAPKDPTQLKQADVVVIKRGMCDPTLFIVHCKDGTCVYAREASPLAQDVQQEGPLTGKKAPIFRQETQVFRVIRDKLHAHKHSYIIMDPGYLGTIKEWYGK